MAVVQYSALVTQLRGKLGGSQFNKGHNVQTLQRKSTPTIRQTPAQMRTRQIMGIVQRAWKTETPERRAQAAAAAQSNPVYNRLGQQVVLTAYNHYVKMMSWRLTRGVRQAPRPLDGIIITQPVNSSFLEIQNLNASVASVWTVNGQSFSFSMDLIQQGVPTGGNIAFRAGLYIERVDSNGQKSAGSVKIFVLKIAWISGFNEFLDRLVVSNQVFNPGDYIRVSLVSRNEYAGAETGYWSQVIQLQ